jgi:hypothetical protein
MAHFLLLCCHTRSLDEIDDADIAELHEDIQAIPSYAWCDRCVTWQPVTELVTTPTPARKPDIPAKRPTWNPAPIHLPQRRGRAQLFPAHALTRPRERLAPNLDPMWKARTCPCLPHHTPPDGTADPPDRSSTRDDSHTNHTQLVGATAALSADQHHDQGN